MANLVAEKPLSQGDENTYALAGLAALAVAAGWFAFMRPKSAVATCPSGTTGTPPNCVPATCPSGTTGTPPNCVPVSVPPSVSISTPMPSITAHQGDVVQLSFTITNTGTVPATVYGTALPYPGMMVWLPAGQQVVAPPGTSGEVPMYEGPVTLGPGGSRQFVFSGRVTTAQQNIGFTVSMLAVPPPYPTAGGQILASTQVQINVPASQPAVCPTGWTGTPPNCVPPPPPAATTTLMMSFAGAPAYIQALAVVGLPWQVRNVGSATARAVSVYAAIAAPEVIAWVASPYYAITRNVVGTGLGDIAPGETRAGAFLMQGADVGASTPNGIIGHTASSNAPEADALVGVTVAPFAGVV